MSDRRRGLQRLEISRAAIRLFREHGVAATTGERIGGAVGLSARSVWRYFRTKESCVEPVLSLATDAFVATLSRWPAERSLPEHLVADYRAHADGEPGDGELVFDVLRLARHEPGLRAVCLVVQERVEPVLAGILAQRLGRSADDVEIRVHAAALNAALRITTEDVAFATPEGGEVTADEMAARMSVAVRAATDGISS